MWSYGNDFVWETAGWAHPKIATSPAIADVKGLIVIRTS
jgi:hypothetical protein